jgi:hypothetical protein
MIDMFPLWIKIIAGCAGIIGLFLLIKSISKMIALYNNPNSVEFSALLPSATFEIKEAGTYEIAVKRPYLFGIIPSDVNFHLVDLKTKAEISVYRSVNLFSQRKNMSGERIVPVSEFKVETVGSYQLDNLNPEKFKERDKFLITPKTGATGFLLIFAILFSAGLFIGGTVLTILSFVKK